MNKQKILITGNAGMIGAILTRFFLDQGFDVIGIDNLSEGNERNLFPKESLTYFHDITDLNQLARTFERERPDFVINCAAEAAEILSSFIRNFTYKSNIIGTTNVINCCVNFGVKKLIHFSSVARFGNGKPPFKETDPINPLEPYGFSKVLNEWDLKEAKDHFGLNYNVIIGFNISSKYQNFYSKYRNALAIFVRQSILGKDITLYGDGNQVRSFSDAQFICDPIYKLLVNNIYSGENFNLGSSQPITLLNAAKIVQAEAYKRGFHPGIIHLEERKEVKVAYCDTAKAKELLKFEDKTNLPNLIREMFDSALTQPIREIKTREYEIDKGIYSYWK